MSIFKRFLEHYVQDSELIVIGSEPAEQSADYRRPEVPHGQKVFSMKPTLEEDIDTQETQLYEGFTSIRENPASQKKSQNPGPSKPSQRTEQPSRAEEDTSYEENSDIIPPSIKQSSSDKSGGERDMEVDPYEFRNSQSQRDREGYEEIRSEMHARKQTGKRLKVKLKLIHCFLHISASTLPRKVMPKD